MHLTDAKEADAAIMTSITKRDLEAVAMLLVGPAAEAIRTAEARKAGLLPGCNPAKEGLESKIQPLQYALSFMRMHETLPAWQVLSDLFEGLFLIRARDAHAASPGADAIFKRSIP